MRSHPFRIAFALRSHLPFPACLCAGFASLQIFVHGLYFALTTLVDIAFSGIGEELSQYRFNVGNVVAKAY